MIAVGPRVMDENYCYTGNQIKPEEMHYGMKINVILRDEYYNIRYVSAIVGDIKEHTLDREYANIILGGGEGKDLKGAALNNGIYLGRTCMPERGQPK